MKGQRGRKGRGRAGGKEKGREGGRKGEKEREGGRKGGKERGGGGKESNVSILPKPTGMHLRVIALAIRVALDVGS